MNLEADLKTILVPVDFSPFSDLAVDYALHLAQAFDAQVRLLHAAVLFQEDASDQQRLQAYTQWVAEQEKKIFGQMSARKMLGISRGARIQTEVVRGVSAGNAILDYVESHPVDLVVMGSHGRTGLSHLLQGSVAEKIVRLAPVPVLTVHRSVKSFQLQRILVPIDFSVYCQRALEHAFCLCEKFEARITILHVVEQDVHPSVYAGDVHSVFEVDPALKKQIIDNMQAFVSDWGTESRVEEYVVLEGKAHKQIVDFAAANHMDLIVISTHGLSGLDYFLLGSTTEKVVRWAACPVLTVKRFESNF
ncbi:MAG: universal stress protein [Calditrichaeota bacterium]|nr:MAG: universal stress protein [Calditrichota bacterium]